MKLFVREKCDVSETEVEIRCRVRDSEVNELINEISNTGTNVIGERDKGEFCQVPLAGIMYFEAVEGKVFAYLRNDVIRVKNTLYEVEETYAGRHFVRISKSVVVNLRTIMNMRPEEGRRVRLELDSGEFLIVSKNYVGCFKKALGMKEAK